MRRVAILALGALFTVVPAAAAHVDRGAAPIYVAIYKGKPLPPERRVPLHGSATWVNGDKRAHRVASDNHKWPAFRLAYRGMHAVKFNRVGRYPYKVDGKAKGVIVVTAGGGGGGGGGSGTTAIHYDVRVTGRAQTVRVHSGETFAPRNGTETLQLDWVSTFTNVTLDKVGSSGVFVIVNHGASTHGTSSATYLYKETRGDIYGPCEGTLSFPDLGTTLLLAGSNPNGRKEFTFWSQLEIAAATRMATEINDRTKQSCAPSHGGSAKAEPAWSADDVVAGGLTFSPFNATLALHAERKDTATTIWSPLSKLAAGDAFTIDMPDQTRPDQCGTNCQGQDTLRLHADVTRHR
jgi:hypothetical protein